MSPATRPKGEKDLVLWLSALAIALLAALFVIETESRYVSFLEGSEDVEIELLWSEKLEDEGEKVTLHFEALVRNGSAWPLAVEALNTQLYLEGEYAGAYSIQEGRYPVAARGDERRVPLAAVLWAKKAERLRELLDSGGGQLEVVGRARVLFDVGGRAIKVFYDVRRAFPIPIKKLEGS